MLKVPVWHTQSSETGGTQILFTQSKYVIKYVWMKDDTEQDNYFNQKQ
jgi:hypothetical protein